MTTRSEERRVGKECVSHGNNGQFFTPIHVADLMACMGGNRLKPKQSVCDSSVSYTHLIGRGAPHGKGGTSLPTSAAVGRVIGENGKKLAFLLVLL